MVSTLRNGSGIRVRDETTGMSIVWQVDLPMLYMHGVQKGL